MTTMPEDGYRSGVHYDFETKKTLIGFRLKVIIQSEFDTHSYCIFVEVAKYRTVGDLSLTIVDRFGVTNSGSLKTFVDEFEIPPDEPILVLVGVETLKIKLTPKLSEPQANDYFDTSPSDYTIRHHRARKRSRNVSKESECPKKVESSYSHRSLARFLEHLNGTSRDEVSVSRRGDVAKKSQSEKSLAEFYEQLQKESEDETTTVDREVENINENHAMECDTKLDLSGTGTLRDSTSAGCNGLLSVETEEPTEVDELSSEKVKRRRRRKHSKKKRADSDVVDAPDVPSVAREYPPPKGKGKHIYFKDDGEIENPGDMQDIDNAIRKYVNGSLPESATCSAFCSRRNSNVSLKTESENSCGVSRHAENSVTNFVSSNRLKKESVHSAKTDDSFPTPRPRHNLETNEQLGTLLMYKELKTCGRYNVQFVNGRDSGLGSRRSSETESCEATSFKKSIFSAPVKREPVYVTLKKSSAVKRNEETCMEDVTLKKQKFDDDSVEKTSVDCEMVMQSKIKDDKIFLRSSNSEWRQLTEECVFKDLRSVDEPVEGQTIVFQVLYLKDNIYPTMSGLILGRILKYDSDLEKVALEIMPSLLDHILRRDDDGEYLPEGMIAITDRTYEMNWFAVKNPRLLSLG